MKRHLSLVILPSVFLLGAAVLSLPAPAQAAVCSGTSGVTVVVKFTDRTETRCAAGNPSSGYAALEAAGFALTYAQGSGAGALCRIDGAPTNVNCGAMPPSNNYWSYWHARPGGAWGYSNMGGGGYDPAPGSVEGWVLGDGRTAPSARAPQAPATATPTLTPTKKPTTKPTHGSTAAPPEATATATAGATGTPPASASATASPTASPTTSDLTSSAPGEATTEATAPTSAPLRPSEDGGGHSWIWGLGLIAALAVAAGTAAIRRRRG